jgi:hypothetical protein
MVRLPIPGQDESNWGTLLNEFLLGTFYEDGTIHYDFWIASRYDKPVDGIPYIHLANDVRALLNRARTGVQSANLSIEDLQVTFKQTDTTPTTTTIGTRKGLNLNDGSNLGVTVTDEPGSNQVTVAIGHSDTGTLPVTLQKDGGATAQRPVLDFEAGSYAVDDAANTRTRIFVPREYLNVVSDPRIGMVQDTGTRQHVQLQSAVDLAATAQTDACVYIPSGFYYMADQITMPTTRSVRLLGAGGGDYGGGTLILFEEVGLNKYAFKFSSNHPWRMEGITIGGPGNWFYGLGTIISQMKGIYCPGPGLMQQVQCGGFGTGIEVSGVGQEWRMCNFGGNSYGMEWVDTPANAIEGHLIERVFFTACARAGIAIADNASMVNVRFKGNGHFGTGPFGIYRYANTKELPRRQTFMENVVFENYSFEGCGNGNIYDEPQDGLIKNITFDSSGESGYGGLYPWPNMRTDLAAIDVGYAENISWRDTDLLFSATQPQMRARTFKNIMSDSYTTLDYVMLQPTPGDRPFVVQNGAPVDGAFQNIRFGLPANNTLSQAGSMAIADEAVDKYDLVELVKPGHVRVARNGAGSQIVGVSVDISPAGGTCVYAIHTTAVHVKNKTGGILQQGSILKPDPTNPGCVMQASDPSDGPIIGRVNDAAIQNNTHGRVLLNLR